MTSKIMDHLYGGHRGQGSFDDSFLSEVSCDLVSQSPVAVT